LFVFQSHFIGLHTIYGKLHILLFVEQEVPEKTDGKVEEEENFHFFKLYAVICWKWEPKANFLASNALAFSSFLDSSENLLLLMISLTSRYV
jgi:hypothetical protein